MQAIIGHLSRHTRLKHSQNVVISVLINVYIYMYVCVCVCVYMLIYWPLQIFNPSLGPRSIKWGSWSVNWRKINLFYIYFSFVKSQQTALRKQERKSYANTKTDSLTNHCYNNTVIYSFEKNYLVRFFVHLKRKILGKHEPDYASIKNQFALFRLNAGSSIIHLGSSNVRCEKLDTWNFDLI